MLIYELIDCNCCSVPLLIQAVGLLKHIRLDLYNEVISSIMTKNVGTVKETGNKRKESTREPWARFLPFFYETKCLSREQLNSFVVRKLCFNWRLHVSIKFIWIYFGWRSWAHFSIPPCESIKPHFFISENIKSCALCLASFTQRTLPSQSRSAPLSAGIVIVISRLDCLWRYRQAPGEAGTRLDN